jgi:hypothetical protein
MARIGTKDETKAQALESIRRELADLTHRWIRTGESDEALFQRIEELAYALDGEAPPWSPLERVRAARA